MTLPGISIKVAEQPTGMAEALMTELQTHLLALAQQDVSNSVDLRSLPMNDADRQQLAKLLGKGEVEISLNTIGKSKIYETSYTGIWWLTHFGDDENILSELIEITHVPEIIISHRDDITVAAQRIAARNKENLVDQN